MNFSKQLEAAACRQAKFWLGNLVLSGLLLGAGGSLWGAEPYGIMHPTLQQVLETEVNHFMAPQVGTSMDVAPPFKAALSLISHLPYVPAERSQGNCGDCWQWAGTGVMEVAHDVQNGVHDRLSVQFINSCRECGCNGGNLGTFASFYSGQGFAIPWANNNAQFQDGQGTCSVPCGNISTTPHYTISSIAQKTITTTGVGKEQAITNIKYVLNQNKALYFAFYLPTAAAWSDFYNFWGNQPESAVWQNYYCGQTWDTDGGGHAVLCIGYNDDDPQNRYWIMVNSWSTTAQRPNGIFRVSMDVNYDCQQNYQGSLIYALLFETLDMQFAGSGLSAPVLSPEPAVTSGTSNTIYWSAGVGRGATASIDQLMESPVANPEPQAWQPISIEGFEGGFPSTGWTVSGTPTWDDTTYAYHGGTHSAWCAASAQNPVNGYTNNMSAWMRYGPFNLADATDARVTFWFKNLSESDYDFFGWYASTNGNNYFGTRVSGDQNTWQSQTFSLTNVYTLGNVCGLSQVWFAFIFTSDGSESGPTYTGAFVDDVVIEKNVGGGGAGPDLVPYQPPMWNDKIPIGITQLYGTNTHSYSGAFPDNQPLYFNWSSANLGSAPAGAYRVHFEVTGSGGGSWDFDLLTNRVGTCWFSIQDRVVGPLAAGSHTFKEWVDYNGTITETNENNNYYERTIQVGAATQEYYAECANNDDFVTPVNSGWLQATQYTFTSLTPGQTYWYRVKARQGGQESGWSNVEHSQQQSNSVTTVTIAGNVQYYGPGGNPLSVAGVTVNLSGDASQSVQTTAGGAYSFTVNAGGNYTVTPGKEDDSLPATGVSTVDISLIRRHILQIGALDSPYKILAADVNSSRSASTMDITFMRQLILGITNRMPAGLWRFVPASYVFADPLNPWDAPKALSYTGVSADQLNQNFLAIKLGDVNNSWSSAVAPEALRAGGREPVLEVSSLSSQPGSVVSATVSVQNFAQVTSAQFTLEWNPAVLRYVAAAGKGLRGLAPDNFGTRHCGEGKLTVSWDDPDAVGVVLPDGSSFCAVEFEVIGAAGSSSSLSLADSVTPREAGVNFRPATLLTKSGEVQVIGPSLQLTKPIYAAGVFRVSIKTEKGKRYSLEMATSLPAKAWVQLPAIEGDGGTRELIDSGASEQQRFYRVRVE